MEQILEAETFEFNGRKLTKEDAIKVLLANWQHLSQELREELQNAGIQPEE